MNVNNAFDKCYWQPGYGSATGMNNFGDPRNVMFMLKYTPKFWRDESGKAAASSNLIAPSARETSAAGLF